MSDQFDCLHELILLKALVEHVGIVYQVNKLVNVSRLILEGLACRLNLLSVQLGQLGLQQGM